MNNNEFDNLTRTLANGFSRRQALKMLGAGITAGLLSSLIPNWVLAQAPPPCGVKTVKIWMKAFIPQYFPGYSAVPGGAGQTMIPEPSRKAGSPNCLLTDQRDFSSDINARSRMTSIAIIDVEQARLTNGRQGTHYCDQTTEVICSTGAVTCQKTGKVRGKGFYGLTLSADRQTITLNLDAATNNPCAAGSPDLSYKGKITITLLDSGQQAQVSFDGFIEPFPAYEMYASVDDGPPQPLIMNSGNPIRSVSGSVLLNGVMCPDCTVCIAGTCSPKICDHPCEECRDNVCQFKCDGCSQCDPNGNCISACTGQETCCDNQCVDKSSDPENCGACNRNCGSCNWCENGECINPCTYPETCCDKECYDLSSDPQHCGDCNIDCGPCMRCENGRCIAVQDCPYPETCCNDQCVDTSSNIQHCGACGNFCGSCMRCEEGRCIAVQNCTYPETCCNDQCVDIFSDSQNCGACNVACGACMHCENGACVQGCPDQGTCCDNQCIDTTSDSQNCGACNVVCDECMHCENGACVPTCSACQTCQNGACVDICGECMHCENGLCVRTCTDEEVCCGDQCINPSEYNCCITRDNGSVPCLNGHVCCASGECCDPAFYQCCGGACVPYSSSHCISCFPCPPSSSGVCCTSGNGSVYGCCDANQICDPAHGCVAAPV